MQHIGQRSIDLWWSLRPIRSHPGEPHNVGDRTIGPKIPVSVKVEAVGEYCDRLAEALPISATASNDLVKPLKSKRLRSSYRPRCLSSRATSVGSKRRGVSNHRRFRREKTPSRLVPGPRQTGLPPRTNPSCELRRRPRPICSGLPRNLASLRQPGAELRRASAVRQPASSAICFSERPRRGR